LSRTISPVSGDIFSRRMRRLAVNINRQVRRHPAVDGLADAI
jgi:hypothetical protein